MELTGHRTWKGAGSTRAIIACCFPMLACPQVMKTYHMYHAESISAESKLKEAEKQEEKQFNKSGDLSMNLLRHEDRPQRRSSVKKIEKMKETVSEGPCQREVSGWGKTERARLPTTSASLSAP